MQDIAEQLRVLGDETRLRILRLLLEESLNVGELTSILGLAQPTVSKHLAELRKAGLVEVVRAAGYSYYRIPPQLSEWWDALSSSLSRRPDEHSDLVRLRELLKQREELSDIPDRFVVPGRSWLAWSRALGLLLSPSRVADFGCGDGLLASQMAGWAEEVVAIDCNPAFLAIAREKYSSIENIQFLERKMECTALADKSVDLVVISQSLHYAADPPAVLREAFRILVEDGLLLILELLPHSEKWVISQLGHRWLGFEPRQLEQWLDESGFQQIRSDGSWRQGGEPFRVVIMSATRGTSKS
jgi:DNA-binding transcriptional ArsR family regulator